MDPAIREGLARESRERILTEGAVAELFHVVLAAVLALLALTACSLTVPEVQRLSSYPGWQAKPLEARVQPAGPGVLNAWHKATGEVRQQAIEVMTTLNAAASRQAVAAGICCATDVTGFGLLGHLLEMTRPSGVDAELDLSALPVLEGAEETVAAGILSSLQPANVRLRRALRNQEQAVQDPRYRLLFDPQTAGGLLISVAARDAAKLLHALRAKSVVATQIGEVLPKTKPLISVAA